MTPEVAQTIVLTFLDELKVAKTKFAIAQVAAQDATTTLEAASLRLQAILNIKDSLLQFPDIMDAFKVLSISPDKLGG